jgi:hypothetical protein
VLEGSQSCVFAEGTHGSSIGAVGAESETIVAVRARTFLFMNLCMSALCLVRGTGSITSTSLGIDC